MNSSGKTDSRSPAVRSERVARIFLKPLTGRYRPFIWLAETALRPFAAFIGPDTDAKSNRVEKILVFDPGVLGDMLLLVPFLRNLRACFPESRIALLGRPGAGAILLEGRLVDEWMQFPIPWGSRLTRWRRHNAFSLSWLSFFVDVFQLRRQRFDLGFAAGWSGDLRGNLVIWLAGARRRVGYGYGGGDFFLTDVVPPDLARPHVADRNLRLLQHIGFPLLSDGQSLAVSPEDERSAKELLARHSITKDDLVIGVHPGAGSEVREWGDERFAEVARGAVEKFAAKILWFSDPAKPRGVPANVDAISLALPFRQLAAVLSHCQLFICNDSGPMHVAAGLKVPVVAVFGPQRPEWFGPRGDGHRVVIRHDIWCRPCADNCMWKEPYCLRLIPVEQVMDAVTGIVRGIVQAGSPRNTSAGRR
jgi:heptosyltransferase-2